MLAAELPATVEPRRPRQADRFEVVLADALRITELPGPAADRAGGQPAVQRGRSGAAAPAGTAALAASTGWSWCRPRSPTGSPPRPGTQGLRRALGEGRLVRRCPPGRLVGRTVFWPAPNVDSGLVALTRREPPTTTATRRAGLRRGRRRLRPAPQGAARRARGLGGLAAAVAERRSRAAGIDPTTRGEQLDVDAFARIAAAIDWDKAGETLR